MRLVWTRGVYSCTRLYLCTHFWSAFLLENHPSPCWLGEWNRYLNPVLDSWFSKSIECFHMRTQGSPLEVWVSTSRYWDDAWKFFGTRWSACFCDHHRPKAFPLIMEIHMRCVEDPYLGWSSWKVGMYEYMLWIYLYVSNSLMYYWLVDWLSCLICIIVSQVQIDWSPSQVEQVRPLVAEDFSGDAWGMLKTFRVGCCKGYQGVAMLRLVGTIRMPSKNREEKQSFLGAARLLSSGFARIWQSMVEIVCAMTFIQPVPVRLTRLDEC